MKGQDDKFFESRKMIILTYIPAVFCTFIIYIDLFVGRTAIPTAIPAGYGFLPMCFFFYAATMHVLIKKVRKLQATVDETKPPSVVKTVPADGASDVDAADTTQIMVTFSKEMLDGSWSWSQMSDKTFPQIVGNPRYLHDKKTCVIDVKLEPAKTYVIWLNTKESAGFKDAIGTPAVPYLLVFQTK